MVQMNHSIIDLMVNPTNFITRILEFIQVTLQPQLISLRDNKLLYSKPRSDCFLANYYFGPITSETQCNAFNN